MVLRLRGQLRRRRLLDDPARGARARARAGAGELDGRVGGLRRGAGGGEEGLWVVREGGEGTGTVGAGEGDHDLGELELVHGGLVLELPEDLAVKVHDLGLLVGDGEDELRVGGGEDAHELVGVGVLEDGLADEQRGAALPDGAVLLHPQPGTLSFSHRRRDVLPSRFNREIFQLR